MSIHTLRLAQFYRLRVIPLLNRVDQASPLDQPSDLFNSEFFEMLGWLSEGVFCGYFDSKEADILWVGLESLREHFGSQSGNLVPPNVAGEIQRLFRTSEPFRTNRLMPDGPQKAFELPLFSHALHLSDRWADDNLAFECSAYLISESHRGLYIENTDVPVQPSEVAAAWTASEPIGSYLANLLAGFMRTLEYMEESRSFFEYAFTRSDEGNDFESFRDRVGGLNAWRVPLIRPSCSKKLGELRNLLEFAFRTSIREIGAGSDWSTFEEPLEAQLASLIESWEDDHFHSFLEFA
jgi:hypothetical protein